MNHELKQRFKTCRFHAVIFDNNKYQNHFDAILNEDYKFFYPETNYSDISDLNQFYDTINTTVETLNELANTKFKAAISYFYFDLLEYYYYDYIDESEYSYDEINENMTIDIFIEYILNKTNQPLIVNQEKIDKESFKEMYDNDMNKTFDLIYEDLLGNVTIDGKSIKSYYDAIVVNGECIHNFIRRSKFEEF